MANPIDDLLVMQGSNESSDEILRENFEYFLPYFLTHPDTQVLTIAPGMAERFEGDFYGLLGDLLTIPESMYWIVMRLSGLDCPNDYRSDKQELYVPDQSHYNMLVRTFYSNRRKTKA